MNELIRRTWEDSKRLQRGRGWNRSKPESAPVAYPPRPPFHHAPLVKSDDQPAQELPPFLLARPATGALGVRRGEAETCPRSADRHAAPDAAGARRHVAPRHPRSGPFSVNESSDTAGHKSFVVGGLIIAGGSAF
jgi:hypothetical protein